MPRLILLRRKLSARRTKTIGLLLLFLLLLLFGKLAAHVIARLWALVVHFVASPLTDINENALSDRIVPYGRPLVMRVSSDAGGIQKDLWISANGI